MSDLFDRALQSERLIMSVMGPHAGESEAEIFKRKQEDIKACGLTYWLCRSPGTKPDKAQAFLSSAPSFVLFLSPMRARGARPTTVCDRATCVSNDGKSWYEISNKIGPVTGKLTKGAYVFALSEISLCDKMIEMDSFCDEDDSPIWFGLGYSTALAQKTSMEYKAKQRHVVAVAQTLAPHSLWVR